MKNETISMKELQDLKKLLRKFLDSNGDLPDKRVEKTLGLVNETFERII